MNLVKRPKHEGPQILISRLQRVLERAIQEGKEAERHAGRAEGQLRGEPTIDLRQGGARREGTLEL
jgi:hypothetical protein